MLKILIKHGRNTKTIKVVLRGQPSSSRKCCVVLFCYDLKNIESKKYFLLEILVYVLIVTKIMEKFPIFKYNQ